MSGHITISVGDYVHSVANRNTAWFTFRSEWSYSRSNVRDIRTDHLILTTIVRRDTQAELTAELAAMLAAHRDGVDVVVRDNDGADTIHALRSADSFDGVRVRVREFPGGNPGGSGPRMEYVNTRTVRSHFWARYPDPESDMVAFYQSVRMVGSGGPDFVVQEGFFDPIRQNTKPRTAYAIVQQGAATGLYDHPLFPPPLFPGSLKPRPFSQELITPERFGLNANSHYGIRWQYFHQAATVLLLQPPPIIIF